MPNLQALRALGDAWEEENLEAEGKPVRRTPMDGMNTKQALNLPDNTWDGTKEGTSENAKMFANMLKGIR